MSLVTGARKGASSSQLVGWGEDPGMRICPEQVFGTGENRVFCSQAEQSEKGDKKLPRLSRLNLKVEPRSSWDAP